jgi:flagellar basal body-associated protein FliL
MGLLTWIIVAIVILAIIGLGIGTFFSGVFTGAQKVASNPVVRNTTEEAKEFVKNTTRDSANEIIDKALQK